MFQYSLQVVYCNSLGGWLTVGCGFALVTVVLSMVIDSAEMLKGTLGIV